MKILTCSHHHCLPFWADSGKGINTDFQLLDTSALQSMKYGGINDKEYLENFPNTEYYRIIQAISEIEIDATAYVSIKFDYEKGLYFLAKRTWVQFSDLPQFIDGVPQVFSEDGNPLVRNLWIADNGTYSPHGFLEDKSLLKTYSVDFWKQWFLKSLLDHRDREINDAMATIAAANRTIDLFRSMCG